MDKATLRHLGELLQVDGLVLGAVSQYNRFNFGFTARLVSIQSDLILWSVSQTGGMITRPLSQVADETVHLAVKDLQVKIRLGYGKYWLPKTRYRKLDSGYQMPDA